MRIKKIENVGELIDELDEVHIPFLAKKVNCDDYENPDGVKSSAKIRYQLADFTERSEIEEFVYQRLPIEKVKFTDGFKNEIYYRNREWLDPLLFLFKKYGYQYFIDYLDESIALDIYYYLDFIYRLDIQDEIFCEVRLNSFFYYENESCIIKVVERELRNEKILKIGERMKK